MVTKNGLSFLINTTRHHISVRGTRPMFHFSRNRDPIGQSTRDPYETGRQKPYGALKGRNMGKIWGKCGQDLGPILATHMRPILHIGNWQPTWEPYEAGGQKPYGPHMGCSHIVVQMGPMCGPCLCANWVHLKIVF